MSIHHLVARASIESALCSAKPRLGDLTSRPAYPFYFQSMLANKSNISLLVSLDRLGKRSAYDLNRVVVLNFCLLTAFLQSWDLDFASFLIPTATLL